MLFATVSRGKKLGKRLFPHRFKDERYHVHLGKEGPYIPVTDYRDIPVVPCQWLFSADERQSREPHANFAKTRIHSWMDYKPLSIFCDRSGEPRTAFAGPATADLCAISV